MRLKLRKPCCSVSKPNRLLIPAHSILNSGGVNVSKKSFPLRINEQVIAAMQRWADDDLRTLNAQIEFVLRDALVKSGRVKLVQKVTTDLEPLDESDEILGRD